MVLLLESYGIHKHGAVEDGLLVFNLAVHAKALRKGIQTFLIYREPVVWS
jgi:hypothetical protein